MKDKHLRIRIEQCLSLSRASNCPRRKFGALLLDPDRNVILMDGYNGGPRGGGDLCGGGFCLRDGVSEEDVFVEKCEDEAYKYRVVLRLQDGGKQVVIPSVIGKPEKAFQAAKEYVDSHPPIKSGTQVEVGCHHAEMNVICNAAASRVKTLGAWLIVTGEPCLMCAKLIHHAGIIRVYVVDGGFAGANGLGYLREHGVDVCLVDGPKDPRLVV